jgi:hypothetical protein
MSSAALQHSNLMVQSDRFQQQRGAGSGFASGDRDRSAFRHRHERRLSSGAPSRRARRDSTASTRTMASTAERRAT